MQEYQKDKTAIIYLAMNTDQDETYGRNSRSLLIESLDKLYHNYNHKFKHDIIIFYDYKYPFSLDEQNSIKNNREEIKFILLDDKVWGPPDIIKSLSDVELSHLWKNPEFPVGYRNMIRFYGILIYEILSNMGYNMYMRLDDDSFIHSNINYDIFEFLHTNRYQYGFRAYSMDSEEMSKNFIEICYQYINLFNIKNHWIDRFLLYGKIWKTNYHNRIGFYNNFSITDLNFWIRKDVQHFLNYIDNTGLIYFNRLGDLMIQTLAIQMFMPRDKIYQFQDWSYEHATKKLPIKSPFITESTSDQILHIGGYYPKFINNEYIFDETTIQWYKKYQQFSQLSYQTLSSIENSSELHADITYNIIKDNNEFMPNGNHDIYYLGQFFNKEDVYHRIDDHLLNCKTTNLNSFHYIRPFAFMWYNHHQNNNYSYKLYAINNSEICKISQDIDCTAILLNKKNNILDGSEEDIHLAYNLSQKINNKYYVNKNNIKTLIIIMGGIRGNEDSWNTLYQNVQTVYNADIMLCVSNNENKTNSSLYKHAKYLIEIPEYKNWIDYYKDHTNINTNELKALFLKGAHIGLAGGIDNNPGSGSIIFAFRHFIKNFCTNILLNYDRVILTRSDHFYAAPHPLLDNDNIWIVEGENYNGITDRHHIFPTKYLNEMLGVVEYMATEDAKQKINDYHTPDPEFVLASSFDFFQISNLIQRFTRYQFTIATSQDATRWKEKEFLLSEYKDLYIKYPEEYHTTLKNLNYHYKAHKFIIPGEILKT